MTGDQFSADDEATSHKRLIDTIRAEQIQHEPEPAHEPSWVDDLRLCSPDPIRHWCCDWHRLHDQETA